MFKRVTLLEHNNSWCHMRGIVCWYSLEVSSFSTLTAAKLRSNEKLVCFSFFDIHFSEVSLFFVFRFPTFIFQKLVCFSFFDIHFSEVTLFFVFRFSTFIFQKLVCLSFFVFRHSFSEVSLFFVFR